MAFVGVKRSVMLQHIPRATVALDHLFMLGECAPEVSEGIAFSFSMLPGFKSKVS